MKKAKRREGAITWRSPPPVPPPPLRFEQPIVFAAVKAVIASVVTVGILHGLLRPIQPPNLTAVVFFLAFAVIGGCVAYLSGREVVARFRRWQRRKNGIQGPEEDFTARRPLPNERSTAGLIGMFIVFPAIAGASLLTFLAVSAVQQSEWLSAEGSFWQVGYTVLLGLGLMTAPPAVGWRELKRRRVSTE